MHSLVVLTTVAALTAVLAMGGCANAPLPLSTPRIAASHSDTGSAYSRGIVQSIDLVHLTAVAGDSIAAPELTQTADAFKFTILMEDRSYQTLVQTTHGDLRVGDRVHVSNGAVRRY